MKNASVFIFLILLLLITSCKPQDKPQIDYGGVANSMVGKSDSDFSEPELIETEVSVSYRFARERVATDLYVDKMVTLNQDSSGIIELDFSGNGEGEYIEVIPKTFAAHVDDIDFSVEPDKIVNPDPVVMWKLNTAKKKVDKIIMKVKETAASTTELVNTTLATAAEFNKLLTGKEVDYSQIQKKAKMAGALAGANEALMDNLDDFLFIADIQVCADKQTEQERGLCILTLVSKKPDWFECEGIYAGYESGTDKQVLIHSCKAIQQDDLGLCEGAQFFDHEEYRNTEMGYVAICQRQFITIKLLACEGLFKDEKEKCIIDKVRGTGYKDACWSLFGEASQKCVAAAEGKEYKKPEPAKPDKNDALNNNKQTDDAQNMPLPETTEDSQEGKEDDCSAYDKESMRNSGYSSQAQKTGQTSFCNMITAPTAEKKQEYTWSCYNKVAMAIPDCSLCDMIDKSNYRFKDCIYQCSTKSMQPAVCEKLLEAQLKEYDVELCKGSVAERKEDASICDGLTNEYARNDCYDKVASRKQDPSICNEISIESDKETCKKYAIPS